MWVKALKKSRTYLQFSVRRRCVDATKATAAHLAVPYPLAQVAHNLALVHFGARVQYLPHANWGEASRKLTPGASEVRAQSRGQIVAILDAFEHVHGAKHNHG